MKTAKLRKIIIEEFKYLKDSKVVILDIPDHTNIGDHLIFSGEIELCKYYGVKILQISSLSTTNYKIPEDAIILLQGGGNFGDLYSSHQNFRLDIINKFPKNKIIIFPQTVFFRDKKTINKSIDIFSKHSDLTIYVRDEQSYAFCRKYFEKNTIGLLPDMAFMLELENKKKKSSKTLYLERKDKELKFTLGNNFHVVKSDWPTYEHMYFRIISKLFKIMQKNIHYFSSYAPLLEKLLFLNYQYYSRYLLMVGANMFSKYDKIITTRLHGHILASLLGIDNITLDNSYGKNYHFINTWTINMSTTKHFDSSPFHV